jgi:hypothetical protein
VNNLSELPAAISHFKHLNRVLRHANCTRVPIPGFQRAAGSGNVLSDAVVRSGQAASHPDKLGWGFVRVVVARCCSGQGVPG